MADFYAQEFVGVKDGTQIPADRAAGWLVGYRPRGIRATKPVGQALAVNDRLYIGRRRAGESIVSITANANASLGTTTLSIGPNGTANKYVNGMTLTAVNVPTPIGPLTVASDNDPADPYEDLWLTVTTTPVAGGTALVIDTILRAVN